MSPACENQLSSSKSGNETPQQELGRQGCFLQLRKVAVEEEPAHDRLMVVGVLNTTAEKKLTPGASRKRG